MGYAKNAMMEEQSRGWASLDKTVCAACVSDEDLKKLIRSSSDDEPCSYCRRSPSAPFDSLMTAIDQGISSEWQDANDAGLFWDGREGGWQGVDVTDTYDLFHDEIDVFENEELRRDVIGAYSMYTCEWVPRDFERLPHDEVLENCWERFSAMVKHATRYVFLLDQQMQQSDDDDPDYLPPGRFLQELDRLVKELNLIQELPAGSVFYRVRRHQADLIVRTPGGLAAPNPREARFPNRMSPAGIPMFYGARDVATCLAELGPTADEPCSTAGAFRTARAVHVLDLTRIPEVPGLFAPPSKLKQKRARLRFLREFAQDVSRPVARDEFNHIEYVPTQVVTEYFRRAFRTRNGQAIHGILYPSAQRAGGVCCVLFFEKHQTCNIHPGWENEFERHEKWPKWWLGFAPRSKRRFVLGPDRTWKKAVPAD